MAFLKNMRLDSKKVLEGRWVEWALGIRVKIARMNNPRYIEILTELKRPEFSRLRRGQRITMDILEPLIMKAMSEAIILDWENVDDETVEPRTEQEMILEGTDKKDWRYDSVQKLWFKKLPYTPERGFAILQDPEYRDFYDFVNVESNETESYRLDEIEEARGN